MKRGRDRSFKMSLPAGVLILGLSLMFLFQQPIAAQVNLPMMPRIDIIKGQLGQASSSYRLIISRPQDIVFVACPERYAPKLGHLHNVKAIQCERF
jgi:hypothetical protein